MTRDYTYGVLEDLQSAMDFAMRGTKEHDEICESLKIAMVAVKKLGQVEQIISSFDGKDGGDYYRTIEKICEVLKDD